MLACVGNVLYECLGWYAIFEELLLHKVFKSLNKVYTFLNYDTTDKRGKDYPIKRDRQKF